jgi:osmoprotectant transport system permease protein
VALLRRLALPLIVSAVGLVLAVWVGTQELDSIEQRQLNGATLLEKIVEHLELAAAASVVVVVLAVSLGIVLTRPGTRRLAPAVIAVANVGQATPSIGFLVVGAIVAGIGFDRVLLALVAYSALPVLRNTMVGLQQVDRSLIEAARGLGMSPTATLLRVELPLSVPVILAGVRTALVVNVGTATLATFVDGGGLGDTINSGIRLGRDTVLVTGAVLTAMMALLLDWVARGAEDLLRPRGL